MSAKHFKTVLAASIGYYLDFPALTGDSHFVFYIFL